LLGLNSPLRLLPPEPIFEFRAILVQKPGKNFAAAPSKLPAPSEMAKVVERNIRAAFRTVPRLPGST
jgi:hypothetical protein